MTGDVLAREFIEFRPRLLGIAYRMLGSAWDAEDIVAEAMVRWLRLDRESVREPLAYLTTMVTRLALDQLGSARATRERYVGEWLPEPIVTDPSPSDRVERRESMSLATLRMMEELAPAERAVFVLHEAFDVPHAEIADVLGITVDGARQHLRRARTRIAGSRRRFAAEAHEHRAMFERFLGALEHGDLDGLRELLAADVVAYSDGGGKARAARRPVVGLDAVVGFLGALRKRYPLSGVRCIEANGQAAALFWFGRQYQLLAVDVRAGKVGEIYSIINPDKLRYVKRQLAERTSRMM